MGECISFSAPRWHGATSHVCIVSAALERCCCVCLCVPVPLSVYLPVAVRGVEVKTQFPVPFAGGFSFSIRFDSLGTFESLRSVPHDLSHSPSDCPLSMLHESKGRGWILFTTTWAYVVDDRPSVPCLVISCSAPESIWSEGHSMDPLSRVDYLNDCRSPA